MIDARRARVFSTIDESIENRARNNEDDHSATSYSNWFTCFTPACEKIRRMCRTNVQSRYTTLTLTRF